MLCIARGIVFNSFISRLLQPYFAEKYNTEKLLFFF